MIDKYYNFERDRKLLPIGFIGLGKMGGAIVENLLENGIKVHGYDRRDSILNNYGRLGVITESSPLKVAERVKTLFLCLPFTPAVEKVIYGKTGILSGSIENFRVIDLSTIYSADAIIFKEKLNDRNIGYCDCPISGLPARARNGSLTIMFGGSEIEYKQTLPYLKLMGNYIIHSGSCGAGQMMKSFNNIIYNINIAAISEILPVAVKLGLKPADLASILTTGSGRSFASEHFIPKMLNREFDDDYQMQSAYKDIENIHRISQKISPDMPIFKAMTKSYKAALEAGYGKEAKNAMLKVYEKKLGIKVG